MSLTILLKQLCNERGMSVANMARLAGLKPRSIKFCVTHYRDDMLRKYIPEMAKTLQVTEQELTAAVKENCEPESVVTGSGMENFGRRRYDHILAAIKDGKSDEEIRAEWPEVTEDVMAVYHKIVDGTLSNFSKNGGIYDGNGNTALEEFCAIAFRTGSLHFLKNNVQTYDGVGRW